jgi:signal transduction histidine kinase/PAS domain-containing protein
LGRKQNNCAFLEGGGEMGALMRAYDWQATPLGPIDVWPQSLRTATTILLRSPVPIVMLWGEDGVMIYNDAYSVFAGGRHPQLLGSKVREGWPEVAAFNDNILKVVLAGGTLSYRDMMLSLNRTGQFEDVYLDLDYSPVLDEAGRPAGVIAIVVEITERVLAERALQDSQERLQLALDAADMGTFVWFPQEDRTEADTQMMALFNLPNDGLLNLATALAHSILPEDGIRYAEAVGRACDPEGLGQLRQDIRVRRSDGSVRWLGINAQVYFEGEPLKAARMAGSALDITDRKLTEAALRESESRLRFLDLLGKVTAGSTDADAVLAITTRMVGEHLGVSICAYADMDEDQDGFTIRGDWAAPGSSTIVGHYSLADFGVLAVQRLGAGLPLVINDNLAEIAPEEAATFQSIGITATICMPLVKEGRLTALMAIHDKVARVWTDKELALITEVTERSWAHIQRVRAEAGLRESAKSLSDLNTTLEQRVGERTGQLLQAQSALHQSQKMETVGQLTGGVAHDFNNLLMPIVGALDMLRGRLAGDERAQRLTSAALQAADRAQTLVQRLLAFSRRQHLLPRAVDVRSLIESMADLVSRSLGPRIRLQLEIAPDLPPAHVDPNQLELALLNLAVNARDAMGGEGVLTVRARPAAEGEILGSSDTFVQIAVTDTGVGMDADTLKRAVEPFFTTKGVGRGTGLGLSSVQGLAEQSGGAFRLTSTPGQGTTAALWLPVSGESPAAAMVSRPLVEDATPRVRNAVILLVDDEDLVRAGAADMLTEAGYSVEEASSGYRAVQMLRGGLRPNVLVTDYAMPGMTGAELAREVRKIAPQTPVLMITGYATLTDREAGDLPRLAKPFRQHDLVAAIEHIMETATTPS